ncbi:iron-containing alcohol dehydrogenase [Laetiporus sulphureus 93-53]|uniref:Iron-containing alcohol dehydrogenase n=1 Tax=Laetiporus sulphureus 93-53 TaxID=1314785 RepID=A0A165DCV2_9APHY|nr:iron-containing alcohol dehydrogenase [Laetiporus sulphureus 93-53]KZT04586.1 iron-containing alcohol dehydrogenase [Laetiporus sulphureus 93-53]
MSGLENTKFESSSLKGSYAWTETLKGVYYGSGSLKTALPKLLHIVGGTKALIVTGKSLYEKTDVVKRVEAVLKERQAYGGTFHEIRQHSPVADIHKGLKVFEDVGADIIISVGGGSPIDASKAILYFHQQKTGGEFLKQIAIPTTLSAAEYTEGAGYTNEEGSKVLVANPQLAPAGIILDAELTLATPEWLCLHSENLYRPFVPPPIKHLCYAALADLFKYLPESKANPEAIDVRQRLQIASWMSLWPLKPEKYSGAGLLSHTLGHKLGATYNIPHGITSCLTLAPTVALKAQIASEEDKEWLSGVLFHLREQPTGSLVKNLGLQSNLEEYKVPKTDVPKIAELAVGSRDDPTYPQVVKLLEGLYPK